MIQALNTAFQRLADAGIHPESVTLTHKQYAALMLDVAQLRVHASTPSADGVVRWLAPWGDVRIVRGEK